MNTEKWERTHDVTDGSVNYYAGHPSFVYELVFLTFKEWRHVPKHRRTASRILANQQFHEEEGCANEKEHDAVRDEKGSCQRQKTRHWILTEITDELI